MVSYRRIYDTTVKKFAIGTGTAGVLIFLMFVLMAGRGDIEIVSHSGDMVCRGDATDPCYANITFIAKTDIYIYPMTEAEQVWTLETEPTVKKVEMFRTWGSSLRRINLSKTWSKKVKYAIKFSKDKEYTLVFKAYKYNPTDTVKWSFTKEVDPVWFGVGNDTIEDENLVLHIPCEGDFRDRSGNGNDGTQSGGVQIGRGIKGRACEFISTNNSNYDYLQISSDSSLNLDANFTITAWIKPSAISGDSVRYERITGRGSYQFEFAIKGASKT